MQTTAEVIPTVVETGVTLEYGLPLVEITLLLFVLSAAVATALLRDVLSSIIVFGAYSLGMAIYYTVLLAPDVGMTEAAVGVGVTTILLLLTIAKTTHPLNDSILEQIDLTALFVVGAFVTVIGTTLQWFPAIGDPTAVAWDNPITKYYLEHTYRDTGVENTVTAVLAAYRGFDTFGEAIVVFTAGVAALIVLHREVFTGD